MAKRFFTKEELDNIIKDYDNGNGLRPFELAKKYDRNPSSISNKLKDLGLYKYTNYRFTEEDIQFIRNYYPDGDWDFIMAHFPNSDKQDIMTKASQLGIKMINESAWSEEELELLKNNYSYGNVNELCKLLPNRTYKAITTKAKRIGIFTREYWTDEEKKLLVDVYEKIPLDDVEKLFPNKNRNSIIHQAMRLHITSFDKNAWTKEDDEYLLSHWKTESDDIMSKSLAHPPRGIQARRLSFGLLHFNTDGSGYGDLSKYLRGHLQTWKNESMKNCNYKCVLTGSKDFAIHHKYGFANIVNETIEEYDIEIKDYKDYTQEELEDILEKFQIVHSRYPLGVCIRKDIHLLYHSIYSKCVNTEDQWNQFVMDFKNGMYDDQIKIA